MGFDDLARHMAARDKRKLGTAGADQIVAEAARSDRRMARNRDLILGLVLLIPGLAMCALVARLYYDLYLYVTGPARPNEPSNVLYPFALTVIPVAMVIVGIRKTIRALRAPAE